MSSNTMNAKAFSLEVQFVEFNARYLWGAIRAVLGRGLARRCSQCILPETYTPIGDDGRCAECRAYVPEKKKPDESDPEGYAFMRELLTPFEGAGKGQYDAMLLFSGGKDSALLLHSVLEMCPGMRILTVLVDNGFMSPFALQNADEILEKFDVDHVTIRPRRDFVRKVFRHALTHLNQQEGYSIVDLMDGYVTFDSAKNLAAASRFPSSSVGCPRPRQRTPLA